MKVKSLEKQYNYYTRVFFRNVIQLGLLKLSNLVLKQLDISFILVQYRT